MTTLLPTRTGLYAIEVLFHKILRRFVAFFLVAMLASSAVLAAADPVWWIVLAPQLVFYALATAGGLLAHTRWGRLKPLWIPYFFCLANGAAALAVLSLLAGVRFERWEPGGRARRRAATARRGAEPVARRQIALPTRTRRRAHARRRGPRPAAFCRRPTPAPAGGALLPLGRPVAGLSVAQPGPVRRAPRLAPRALPGGGAGRARGRTGGAGGPHVAITFDDGYADNRTHALPLLAARDMTATFFVTVGFLECDDEVMAHLSEVWRTPRERLRPLSWSEVRELRGAGMAVGSHTWSHRNLAPLSPGRAEHDLGARGRCSRSGWASLCVRSPTRGESSGAT